MSKDKETRPPFPWLVELMEGDQVFDTLQITSQSKEMKFKECHRPATFTAIRISDSNGAVWRSVPLEAELAVFPGVTPVIQLTDTLAPTWPDDQWDTLSLTDEERDFLRSVLVRFPFEYRRRALVDSILRKLDRL